MADTHVNVPSAPDGTPNTARIGADVLTNGENLQVLRQWVRALAADGDLVTLGTTNDAPALNFSAASLTIASILRGIGAALRGTGVRCSFTAGTTIANSDNAFTFSPRATSFYVQNNTANPIYVEFDATATPGSTLIPAGYLVPFRIPCTVLHIYTTAAVSVNGTTAGGIVVVGFY